MCKWKGKERGLRMSLLVAISTAMNVDNIRVITSPHRGRLVRVDRLVPEARSPAHRAPAVFLCYMRGRPRCSRSPRNVHIASCTLACTPPAKRPMSWVTLAHVITNLRFRLHRITKMDCKLSNVPERMLVRSSVVRAEELACRVLHEGNRGQCVCARGFA